MSRMSADKKIILSITAFVAVMALIVGALFLLGRDKEPELPVDDSQVNYYEPGSVIIDDDTTAVDVTLSPAMQDTVHNTVSKEHISTIEAFVAGRYYISLIDYSNAEAMEMSLALRGQNVQMSADINGMKLDVMILNDNIYLVNSTEKKYIDFKSMMQMAGGSADDFDMTEMRELAEMLDISEYEFTDMENFREERNGVEYIGYGFYSDEIEISFWFVGDELRQLDFASAGGADKTSIDIKEFSAEIPEGMLTLIGLTRSNIFDFFGEEFMKSMQ